MSYWSNLRRHNLFVLDWKEELFIHILVLQGNDKASLINFLICCKWAMPTNFFFFWYHQKIAFLVLLLKFCFPLRIWNELHYYLLRRDWSLCWLPLWSCHILLLSSYLFIVFYYWKKALRNIFGSAIVSCFRKQAKCYMKLWKHLYYFGCILSFWKQDCFQRLELYFHLFALTSKRVFCLYKGEISNNIETHIFWR